MTQRRFGASSRTNPSIHNTNTYRETVAGMERKVGRLVSGVTVPAARAAAAPGWNSAVATQAAAGTASANLPPTGAGRSRANVARDRGKM
jgi:hypothetical protein